MKEAYMLLYDEFSPLRLGHRYDDVPLFIRVRWYRRWVVIVRADFGELFGDLYFMEIGP